MEAESLPVDLELALELLKEDIERLVRAAEALERSSNPAAAYEARAWKLAMGSLYSQASSLADAIKDERMLEASQAACLLASRLHTVMKEALDDRYTFVTGPSRRILAMLLSLANGLCGRG